MMKLAWSLIALAACSRGETDREHACAQVRNILEHGATPRRYQAGEWRSKLEKLELGDAEVKDAVNRLVIDAKLLFIDEPDPRLEAFTHLRTLCQLKL
jgi:hypothetical protein